MVSKASNTTIGAFVLAAILLGAVGIVVLGKGSWFRSSFTLAFEFEGDVSGLVVGAPVTIKGFKIGSVRELRLDYDIDSGSFRTTALAEMTPNIMPIGSEQRVAEIKKDRHEDRERERVLREMVADGARAQLNQQSFVTGLLKIDIDFPPNTEPATLEYSDEGFWRFPTQSSSLEVLQKTLTNLPVRELVNEGIAVLKSIRSVTDSAELRTAISGLSQLIADLQGTATQLDQRMSTIEGEVVKVTGAADEFLVTATRSIQDLETQASATLVETRALIAKIDERVEPTAARIASLADAAEGSLNEAGQLLSALNGLTPSDSALAHQLSGALSSLTATLDSLRVLSEYLEQHPEALLRGKD